jgi:hypothetical protein
MPSLADSFADFQMEKVNTWRHRNCPRCKNLLEFPKKTKNGEYNVSCPFCYEVFHVILENERGVDRSFVDIPAGYYIGRKCYHERSNRYVILKQRTLGDGWICEPVNGDKMFDEYTHHLTPVTEYSPAIEKG